MLSELFVSDFAIVRRLELGFGAGLTVLTGETGAGKSILIDALALALGERAETGAIRVGAQRAEVVARFDLAAKSPAADWLREHELFEDGECVLRRVVETERPSRAFINGRPVPVQLLRELGDLLVDVHGQHEHQSLLRREAQRDLLDGYAGLQEQARALAERYQALAELEARLLDLRARSADHAARLEFLRYQVEELERLALGPDEIPGLEEEYARLSNGAELLQGARELADLLYDSEDQAVSRLLARALARLSQLARFDPRLEPTGALLNEATIQVDEAAAALRQYADGLEPDPERLQWVDQRLAAALELARKHRVQPPELPALTARLRAELDEMGDPGQSEEKLQAAVAAAAAAYDETAAAVSRGRKQAAKKLSKEVSRLMDGLGMPGGRFEAHLAPLPPGTRSRHGLEQVEFLVSANPGQPPKALSRVASGGELSRISLALQVAAAGLGQIPTLIFDEVDVGIGGAVAEIVGQQLRALGGKRQVLCITHLGQVAAQGEHHFQVSKETRDGETVTGIQKLGKKERVQEIARMIGGVEINAQTLALAKTMLAHVAA